MTHKPESLPKPLGSPYARVCVSGAPMPRTSLSCVLGLFLLAAMPAVAEEVDGVVYLPMESGFYFIDHDAGCYSLCIADRCAGPFPLPNYGRRWDMVSLEELNRRMDEQGQPWRGDPIYCRGPAQ